MTETTSIDVSTPPDALVGRAAGGELTASSRRADPARPVGRHETGGQ